MRDNFINSLIKLAEKDKDIVLLTGDLGFGVFEKFESSFPDQYFNVGVAEQNMIGLATGLALEGKKVVTYSIGNFGTLRCLEQIRNDIAYHNSNVMIVSSGAGFSYGALGPSHHATEDIGFVKSIPNIRICSPASQYECSECITPLLNQDAPSYLRLDKYSSSQLQSSKPHSLEDLFVYHRGQDSKVLLLAHGTTLDLYLSILSLYPELSPFITIISCPFLPFSDSTECPGVCRLQALWSDMSLGLKVVGLVSSAHTVKVPHL